MNTNPQPPRPGLEQQLRDGARHRRTTLERLAPAYPVGHYPPRGVRPPAAAARGPWRLGLSGLCAAVLLGLAALINARLTPAPPPASILAAEPRPDTLGPSVRSLFTGLTGLESQVGQRIAPAAVGSAAAWPERLGELSAALISYPTDKPNILEKELEALRFDLRGAADRVRRQWQPLPALLPDDGGRAVPPRRLPAEPLT